MKGSCWLKDHQAADNRQEQANRVSGFFDVCGDTTRFEDAVDYQGSDLVKGGVKGGALTAQACCRACVSNPQCDYWTWGKDGAHSCWLKANSKGWEKQANRQSGSIFRAANGAAVVATLPPAKQTTPHPSAVTLNVTKQHSVLITRSPTDHPTLQPSEAPTDHPTAIPSGAPTDQPSAAPSLRVCTSTPGPAQLGTVHCPGDVLANCLGGEFYTPNSGIATLTEAWRTCCITPGCGIIMKHTDGKFYLRRASDTFDLNERTSSWFSFHPDISATTTPSHTPTDAPSAAPTEEPTAAPTQVPSLPPTDLPTLTPTELPTTKPPTTNEPSFSPTHTPTHVPSDEPTVSPTAYPTDLPTVTPTSYPTDVPTLRCRSTPFLWRHELLSALSLSKKGAGRRMSLRSRPPRCRRVR
jgi:hypothetical protein